MSNWRKMRELARTFNTEPSLTDQSQEQETNINVIIGRMGISGQVPGPAHAPMGGDFTQLPRDLRDFIERSRGLNDLRKELPDKLRDMPIDELLSLTPTQVKNLLNPEPAKPAEVKE